MYIDPKNENLLYSGRVDFDSIGGPTFVFPCTSVTVRFRGSFLKVKLRNHRAYFNSFMGVLADGVQSCICIEEEGEPAKSDFLLYEGEFGEHEVTLFKRQDSCHTVQIVGFDMDDDGELLKASHEYKLRLEFYGDSVTAGEVSEAVEYCGKSDPPHKGEYSNSYYGYAWTTARMLGAELHDIAQGGIALLDDTGWFGWPHYKGIFNVYDRIQYNPDLGVTKKFDFESYKPDVVVIAIGQNDANPRDYMKEDYDSEEAVFWRMSYKYFIKLIRTRRPNAQIILATTILNHDPSWDRAIEEVCADLQKTDSKIHHFLYTNNGSGTPGHIRRPEAEKMASELSAYILGLCG